MTPVALVGTVVLNGHVSTTDPATGRAVRPCVVSIVVERAEFAELVLDEPRLDPQRCLRSLGAVISRHPHDLEPAPPIVDFDPARFKIAADIAVVGPLDSRPDLLQMDPFANDTYDGPREQIPTAIWKVAALAAASAGDLGIMYTAPSSP